MVFHLVPHTVPCLFAEQPWLQAHWASPYTFAAAHAVRNLLAQTLCLWQEQQTAHALVAWHIDIAHRATHHRTTANHFTCILWHTACKSHDLGQWCTETHVVVTWFSQALTSDGHHARDEWFILLHCLIYSIDSSHVVHHSTYLNWQRTAWHLATDTCVDELFLATLWVFQFEGFHLNAQHFACESSHVLDSIRFVGLDTDNRFLNVERTHQQLNTDDNLLAVLEHELVVASQVWLALHAVHD